jgi:hypothetical protein
MTTATTSGWKVQEGFGPLTDDITKCWGMRSTKRTFTCMIEAEAYSEQLYERRVRQVMKSDPDDWQSYWTRVIQVGTPTPEAVIYYAVYESDNAKGYDADYEPCESKEEAIREATGYLSFASGRNDVVYVVAVPESMCVTDNEEWSLWDCLGEIEADPASEFIYLHRGRERLSDIQDTDIVADLRSLADDEDDTLGLLLKRAADEIERLRGTTKK